LFEKTNISATNNLCENSVCCTDQCGKRFNYYYKINGVKKFLQMKSLEFVIMWRDQPRLVVLLDDPDAWSFDESRKISKKNPRLKEEFGFKIVHTERLRLNL
jgi:hypothetical protein